MNRHTKIERQGNYGERLVQFIYEQRGFTVELAEDKFDHIKDMLIDGVPTEVKMQTPYYMYRNPMTGEVTPAFTVPITSTYTRKTSTNQLSKILNIPLLIFVELPRLGDYKLRVYQAPSLGNRQFSITQNKKDHRYVCGFPIRDMTLIATHDATEHKQLLDDMRSTGWNQE